jgi:magnesium-transporting ATPase (P-type)
MQLGPIFGIGFGWGSEARYGIASVTSGLLGGDVIVAYAFGGLIGLSFVFAFWWYILMSRKKARTDASRLAADMVILLVAAYSVIEPILLQLVFTTGVVSVMLLVCLCMLERSHTFFSHRIAFRCFYCESPAYFQHPK